MAEYIEREAFLKDIEERYCLPCKEAGKDHNGCKCRACWVDDMLGEVIDAPAADVAPVVHGEWEAVDWREYDANSCEVICYPKEGIACTRCRYVFKKDALWKKNFCPNCGARMDGDGNALD